MTMNPLHGPELKIRTAQKRTQTAREMIASYQKNLTASLVEQVDAEGGKRILIKSEQALDEDLFVVVADVGYHLRSALDQTVVAIAVANGKTGSGCYFPFAETKAQFELPDTQKKIKKLPQDVQDLISSTKPYAEGNAELWGLGRLANIDKHNSLVPMGDASQMVGAFFSHMTRQNARTGLRMPLRGSLAEGIELFDLGQHGTVTFRQGPPQIRFAVSVVLGDNVPVFAGQPVAETLDRLIDCANGIIEALKAHSFGE